MSSPPALSFDRTYLTPGLRVCVAVSGGADSVALLTGLHAANRLPREALGSGCRRSMSIMGCAGRRRMGPSFVEELCGRLAVPLQVQRVDVGEHVAQTRETMEEAARTLRYRAFDELLASGGADAVVTAHTLDDQAETVLMKLLRGAWTEGLGGIHPVVRPGAAGGGRILRPLLGTSRGEVEAYLRACGQSWREDTSNADPAHTRNRLRHRVLPMLREENPSLDQTLANLAVLARDEEARWQTELGRLLPHLLLPGKPVRGGGRAVATTGGGAAVAVELERLRALDVATRRRVVRAAVRSLGAAPRLSFVETERILALCGLGEGAAKGGRGGVVLDLAHGLRAERTPRELRLSLQSSIRKDEMGSSSVRMDVPQQQAGLIDSLIKSARAR